MRRLLLAGLLASMSTPPAVGQAPPKKPAAYVAEPRKWEHEQSDLAPDPRFNFGSFKNGLRYVWVQNRNPPKQVLLRLHVNVGSVVETRDELGLAHFLEHMAFNGSKNFKAGALVPIFQGQGLKFGSHVNAYTSFLETVYVLDLPDHEPKRLEKALTWFRDVIDGLKLDPAEIEAEKGVVDAEHQLRGGLASDIAFEPIKLLLDGSRFPRRFPIGDQPVRAKFNKKICTGFYDRWYRPENMTFIVIGDLGDQDPRPALEKVLGEARGRGTREDPPGHDLDQLSFKKTLFTQHWPGRGDVQLFAGRFWARADETDDAAARGARVALALACDILETRLNEVTPRPYILASAASGETFHLGRAFLFDLPVADGLSLRLTTTEEDWQLALQFAHREIRRFLERGITDEEMKAAFLRLDQRCVARPISPPPRNEEILEELIRACNERYVPMGDREGKEIVRKAGRGLDGETCLRAFRNAWEEGTFFICSEGGLDLKDSAAEMFEDAWNEGATFDLDTRPIVRNDLSVKAPKREKGAPAGGSGEAGAAPDGSEPPKGDAKKYAYALPDAAVPAAEKKQFAELRACELRFPNGVRASAKHVDGSQGRFRVEVRVGEGMFALEPEQADLAKVASRIFLAGGTTKNTHDELVAALGAVGTHLSFHVGGDACRFSSSSLTTGGEPGLRRALEVVVAYLTDASFRSDAFTDFKKHLGERLTDTDRPTTAAAFLHFEKALANGDRRLLPLERPFAEKVTLDEIRGFLAGQLTGPVEVTVVGELFLEKQVRLLESTLGQLPLRRAAAAIPDARRSAAPAKTGLYEPRSTVDPSNNVAHVHIVYPCPDAIDIKSARQLDLLGDLVNERLRAEIREKLGATYSPRGGASGDDCFRGRGFVELDLMIDPSLVASTREACLVAMEQLAKTGAKKEEFERLRTARSGNPQALADDLDFWLRELGRARRTPSLYDELKDLKRWYDRVTLEEINALARQVLPRDRASVLVITPR